MVLLVTVSGSIKNRFVNAVVEGCRVLGFTGAAPAERPVRELIGEPKAEEGGWFRCPWTAFDDEALPEDSTGQWGGKADWQRAWHGCKFEAFSLGEGRGEGAAAPQAPSRSPEGASTHGT